jgi:iron complex transport system ATP-binding protein
MEQLLEIKDLSFSFGDKFSLNNITFTVNEGSFLSVIGRNGSGKSTLIKIISGILTGYSGMVKYKNRDISSMERKEFARSVSYLPQHINLFNEDLKVYEFLLLGRYPYKSFSDFSYNESDHNITGYAINFTGVEKFTDKKLNELSGGERQKVFLTLSFVQLDLTGSLKGKVLIIDEPITYLDINHQYEIFNLLKKLNTEKGLTVVTVVHDLNLAYKYTDYCILIADGAIADAGAPPDVITKSSLNKYFLINSEIENNNIVFN